MGTVLLRFLVGAIAGLAAWMFWEPAYPKTLTGDSRVEGYMVMCAGIFIGASIAGLSGYAQGGKVHTLRGLGLGALFGGVGAMFGYGIGAGIVNAVFPKGIFVIDSYAAPVRMMARTAAILPMGALLGLAVGAATLNAKRAVQGLIGGVLAGAVCGFLFDPLASVLGNFVLTLQGQRAGETGTVSRALTFLLLGASIGLFIGLVERFARSAWLRLQLGRNEGKEWSIDSGQTFIGRSEGATVPLFGDPNVAPIHCSIQRQGQHYILVDGGSPIGTLVNGHPIQSVMLVPGCTIQVGSYVLTFLMKNHPAPQRGPEAYGGQAYPMGGQPMAPVPMPAQGMPAQGIPAPGMPAPGMPGPAYGGPLNTSTMPRVRPQGPANPSPVNPSAQMPTQAYIPAPSTSPTIAYGAGMAAGGLTLAAIDGPIVGQRFGVSGPLEVGRDASGIKLAHDANASRRHALLTPSVGSIAVQDLGSTNGTFVNGQRVNQASIGPGDTVKIGSTTFRVEAS